MSELFDHQLLQFGSTSPSRYSHILPHLPSSFKSHTRPPTINAAQLRARIPRIIHARLVFVRTFKSRKAAADFAQGDTEARTIGFDGASVRELFGGVDAIGTVGTGVEASAAADWGYRQGREFFAVL